MTAYAYLRVSTIDQDTEKNKLEILKFANYNKLGNIQFVEEQITGRKHFKFRQLGRLLDEMQKGDVLIVPEFSRLARSIIQIFEVLDIIKRKDVVLYSLKENFCTNDDGITATVLTTVFALIAQIERDLISQRTKCSLASKKEQGIKLGRPIGAESKRLKLSKNIKHIQLLLAEGVSKNQISKIMGVQYMTLSRFIKRFKL